MSIDLSKTININIGVLGHIDSGKTSLTRGLSQTISTAALDKSPQSQERGITLDLGFSSFQIEPPPQLREKGYEHVQCTLVDCPGHASLIRTIIGGAQIIDLMIMVIDATRGIQTQTAEGLVIGEIATDNMIVALNKIDLIPEEKRQAHLEKLTKGLRKALAATRFKDAPMIPVAACPGAPPVQEDHSQVDIDADKVESNKGGKGTGSSSSTSNATPPVGLDELVKTIRERIPVPQRQPGGPFIFSVDHCFPIKGHGTVMTGTILSGSVEVGQMVELPTLKLQRKVKSMQMFHQSVNRAVHGDRVGICVSQLDAKLVERGIVCDPGHLTDIHGIVTRVEKIKFFKNAIKSKSKFHVTVGHATVMATASFFTLPPSSQDHTAVQLDTLSLQDNQFNFDQEYIALDELQGVDSGTTPLGPQWAILTFEKPVICPVGSTLIGSRLDTEVYSKTCRIAFTGYVSNPLNPHDPEDLARVKIYKPRQLEGVVDRIVDDTSLVARDLFTKDTDMSRFMNMKVSTPAGDIGVIESTFGQGGKFKVRFREGYNKEETKKGTRITFSFKKFVNSPSKKIVQ